MPHLPADAHAMRKSKPADPARPSGYAISKPISRRPASRNEFGRQAIKEPFLIVEILSPSTERHDRRVKLPVYRQIETVQEILLIASDGHLRRVAPARPERSGSPISCAARMRGLS